MGLGRLIGLATGTLVGLILIPIILLTVGLILGVTGAVVGSILILPVVLLVGLILVPVFIIGALISLGLFFLRHQVSSVGLIAIGVLLVTVGVIALIL